MNHSNKPIIDKNFIEHNTKETRGESIFPNTLYPLLIYAAMDRRQLRQQTYLL